MNEHILALPHCAFKTNCFQEMVSFYRDTLGLQELFTLQHNEASLIRTKQVGIKNVGDEWIKYFKIAPNMFVELFDEKYEKLENPGDFSYSCLTITVEDLAEAAKELLDKGQTLYVKNGTSFDTVFTGDVSSLEADYDKKISFGIKDPEGNIVELAQYL